MVNALHEAGVKVVYAEFPDGGYFTMASSANLGGRRGAQIREVGDLSPTNLAAGTKPIRMKLEGAPGLSLARLVLNS
jgi:hypothetical protein